MAAATQGKKAQCESMETAYIKPSACSGTAVLRTKNIVLGKKLFQNRPQFPVSNIFTSFHGGAYVATTFVS